MRSWSFSKLGDFEQCALRLKLKHIDKIPEPERQLREGQTEHANDRGSRIHDACERYVRGQIPEPPPEARLYHTELASLKTRFQAGAVELEGEWGFDENWEPCDYKTAWLRMKCDAVVQLSKKHVLVIDYKTGRKFGNEIKHAEQVQLYAIATSIKYPEAETIDVELWYFDQKDGENYTHESKPASKWLYHLKLFNNRGKRLMNETEFAPNPNAISCKWCPYKDGICPHAVTTTVAPRRKGQFK